jgi:hypothetical protein
LEVEFVDFASELTNPLGGDVLDLVGANATLTHGEVGPSSEMRFVLP